jgi:hypothetical protein
LIIERYICADDDTKNIVGPVKAPSRPRRNQRQLPKNW